MAKTNKRIQIDGVWYRVSEKTGRPSKVPLTRCNNTWTESEFVSWIIKGLQNKTMMWPPAQEAWKLNRRPNQSASKHKWEHLCNHCKGWFVLKKVGKRNSVELDHIIPSGGTTQLLKDFMGWAGKAYIDTIGYQKLCFNCHQKKSKNENNERKFSKK